MGRAARSGLFAHATITAEAFGGRASSRPASRALRPCHATLLAIDLAHNGVAAGLAWQQPCRGTPAELLAADDKLFIVDR